MKIGWICSLLLLSTSAIAQSPTESQQRVAAFARLYGVLRYFYPGDGVQTLDWDGLGKLGTKMAAEANRPAAFGRAMQDLFEPIAPGVQIVRTNEKFVAWNSTSDANSRVEWQRIGYAENDIIPVAESVQAKRTHREGVVQISQWRSGPVRIVQRIDAKPLRGQRVRFSASLAVRTSRGEGSAWIDLQASASGQIPSLMVSARNRPARSRELSELFVEGRIDPTAETLTASMVVARGLSASMTNAHLEVKNHAGQWQPVDSFKAIDNSSAWILQSQATGLIREVAEEHGVRSLQIRKDGGIYAAPSYEWYSTESTRRYADFLLDAQWKVRVPLTLTESEARITPRQSVALGNLKARLAAYQAVSAGDEMSPVERMADWVALWSVLRHFYPYWQDLTVDWDEELSRLMPDFDESSDRRGHRNALRRAIAQLQDGHASVGDALKSEPRAWLPISIEPVDGDWVVVGSEVDQVEAGDRIISVDGNLIANWEDKHAPLISASPQLKLWKLAEELSLGKSGGAVKFGLERGGQAFESSLLFNQSTPVRRKGLAPLTEVAQGIWYVDMTRADTGAIGAAINRLASAKALVVDLRGYPQGGATLELMPHLISQAEHTRWMHVARIRGPFSGLAEFSDIGWDLSPKSPHIGGNVLFLTDGRAFSQSDSVLAYVKDLKLGQIVGTQSGGTNGDINAFATPSGFVVSFTGLRVSRLDGRTRHFGVGTLPDIQVAPTLAGVRGGADEVLERALLCASEPLKCQQQKAHELRDLNGAGAML